ncbi:unnamed protein product [Acanthoscelides obtectus]|uniref:Thioredoxin domain-containing protein n=1 Tax=Acanthoscelides obtectus TaxID=200917 RepID=A0A9P0PRA2_ACAOB|nr:unnamed protein product [Acanthoscelides obtectus]CAK1636118.1 Thioredoxin domain-containing protein 5 homolog [Acanthoscelides obtectus]
MLNEDDSDIKIAKVDCSTDSKVCLKEDITGYPTLKFYKLGDSNGIKFRGTRDLPSLTNFINEQLREGDEKDQESEEVPQVMKHGLVELTEKTFESHVATGNHFVKFYAPWCGYCQIEKYKGERQHDNLKAFVEQMKQPDGVTRESEEVTDVPPETISVGELTANTFKLGIESGLSFVKFFAPWCGHCKRLSPIWDSLAEKFGKTDGVHISKVDCTLNVNKQLCNDEGIEGFPTLILYKDGAKLWEYTGSRSLDELSDFVKHHLERHDEL